MINKSASQIGTLKFKNGNRTTLWIGSNHNTGDTIVWQVRQLEHGPGRSTRVTGRNLAKLATELNFVLCEGEAAWEGAANNAALDGLKKYITQ